MHLFDSFTIRAATFRNRIFVSPMCQYSSDDGLPNDWHFVHLGSRAVGGAGLVMVEASGVSPEGRITAWDSGIWSQQHADAFRPIAAFIESNGAVAGIQLAHAGRKASTDVPWRGGRVIPEGPHSWQTVAPSPIPFRHGEPVPHELTAGEIDDIVEQFARSTALALDAGFHVVELHMAHGYLLHEFLSPLSNVRTDDYGGSLENRMRFPLRVTERVRQTWPDHLPLFVRISASDWAEGGWDLPQSIEFAKRLRDLGVDLIDCSSGGAVPGAKIEIGPGYQVPFARAIRAEAGIATGAVGLITDAHQADEIIRSGSADAVLLARELLRDPYWPLHAAHILGVDVPWPDQYLRAKP
ncbi:MAG: NADH:flavin oxidoreductase/NADH oxidase [Acidobacteria bacterium]|nr:NADH:flavin oxidoreductase/NADH oxidase [Acidobacteriota bacterium]MBV9068461.1 NADH:flavin oxidoreductase/NADH oxidase [Acidobacteriota bacterium]MBV9187385.1 NADH:flavin oxidoreductase/NADH oxidase [Acidobacteriota bacterium]